MIRDKVKVHTHFLTDAYMRGNGLTENNMEMGRILANKVKLGKVSGFQEKCRNG